MHFFVFYSDLKQKAVSDSDYESSFYLYRTLKMRNLGDMNDLYNAQEVGKNRFQFMHDRENPRICHYIDWLY